MGRKFHDLTGKVFGDLTVLCVDPHSGGAGRHKRWLVQCKCGTKFTAKSCHLKNGAATQCRACADIENNRAGTNPHSLGELQQLQALPLSAKIERTKDLIRAWYEHYDGRVYVSFSGGKDSTVLLHVARSIYTDMPAVYIETGLEYPEIRRFVDKFDNVIKLYPKLTFKQVCQKYGYPIFGKEIAANVQGAREYIANPDNNPNENRPHLHDYHLVMGKIDKYGKVRDKVPPEDKSIYTKENYKFMLDADFEISAKCCDVMKKAPVHSYNKKNNMHSMVATMASESKLRTYQWIRKGCNAFDGDNPISKPMSFWTEQDVLMYIYLNDIEIASVYGDVVTDREVDEELYNELDSLEGFDLKMPVFSTTKLARTGCMFCLFGIQRDGVPNRLQKMKESHPKQYEFLMKPESEGGLGYKDKIDWINEHGDMKLKY